MKRNLKLVAIFGLVGLAILIGLFVPKPATPLPKPNGYDDFLKAGSMLAPDPIGFNDLSTDELRALVARNADALRLTRAGVQRECRVPLDYSMSYASNHISDLDIFKRLVRAIVAEGKLAERENRPKDAAPAYLDAIRLGHECSRGGVIIDMLVGVGGQAFGCRAMRGLLGHLQAQECREAIHQLEGMESKSEPATDIVNHERSWGRRTFGWRGQLVRLMTWQSLKQIEQKAIAKLQAQQRASRQQLIDLAVRAYELEKGQSPKNVTDLVPVYLKSVPQDPLTGTIMALP